MASAAQKKAPRRTGATKPPADNPPPDPTPITAPAEPVSLTRRAPKPRPEYLGFARRLKDAMLSQNMSASDLARAVWGTTQDYRGYTVARNRDRVGHYLAGVSYPEAENLQKIEVVLGLEHGALALSPAEARNTRLREVRGASGDVSFTILSAHPTVAVIQIRKLVTVETGMKILELIAQDKLPDELDPAKAENLRQGSLLAS